MVLLQNQPDIKRARHEWRCAACRRRHRLQGRQIWSYLNLALGGYFAYTACRLLRAPGGTNCVRQSDIRRLLSMRPRDHERAWAAKFAGVYLHSIDSIAKGRPGRQEVAELLLGLAMEAPKGRPQRLALDAGSHLLTVLHEHHTEAKRRRAAISFHDLPALARRTSNPKSGARFERRVEAAMTVLGFEVVASKPQDVMIDLICRWQSRSIWGIDMKSSRRPYRVRYADARALREYGERLRESYGRRFRGILLVGSIPAEHIIERLARFTSTTGIKSYFLEAGALVTLIEERVSPAALDRFLSQLENHKVITTTVVECFLRDDRRRQAEYENWVREKIIAPAAWLG